MFQVPKRKYLIVGGAIATVLVVASLVVFLSPDETSTDTTTATSTVPSQPTTPNASSTTPNASSTTPNASSTTPNASSTTPNASATTTEGTTPPVPVTPMLEMLDAMQRLMTGGGEYDRQHYQELRSCMRRFDSRLPEAQDGAWQGMVDYWLSDGVASDRWGEFGTAYMEQNVTVSDYLNMTIYEPCNYASNVAYYHDVTEFCRREDANWPVSIGDEYVKGFGQAFSTLAFGSAFMHGSHTSLGGQQDTNPIKVLALLVHQGSLSGLPKPPSTILSDLSLTPLKHNSTSLAGEFVKMHLTMPVESWFEHTDALAIPNYYLIFSGIFTTALTLVYPDEFVDEWAPKLSDAFGVPAEDQAFILEYYLPEVRNATEYLHLTEMQKNRFEVDAWTMFLKLVYAFLWQEEVLTDNSLFLLPLVNELGMNLLPRVNENMNEMNSFEYYEENFQNGVDIYPGDEYCNDVSPHAKWHLQSAIGLLDLAYLADEMHSLLSQQRN